MERDGNRAGDSSNARAVVVRGNPQDTAHITRKLAEAGFTLFDRAWPGTTLAACVAAPGPGADPALESATWVSGTPTVVVDEGTTHERLLLWLEHGASEVVSRSDDAPAAVHRAIARRRSIGTEREHGASATPTPGGLTIPMLFTDRVEQALLRANRSGEAVGVILVMVRCGDRAPCEESLASASEAIVRRVRRADSVSQVGPATFAVLLNGIVAPDDAAEVAGNLTHAIESSLPYCRQHHLSPRCTTGTSVHPFDGATAPALLAVARRAIQRREAASARPARIFEPVSLARELHRAAEQSDFTLAYQPQVSAVDGALTAVEALARWHHPHYGWVPPDVFIPVAERLGDIVTVGAWALRQALRDAGEWRRRGMTDITIAVNVSAAQVLPRRGEGLLAVIEQALDESGWDPELLELELTETLSFTDQDAIVREVEAVARLGVRLGADDFGMGKSALSHLRQLPLHTLKIDRGFIAGLVTEARDLALVDSLVYLGHSLGLRTVAEGVSTTEQAATLRRLNCDALQGYLFAQPLASAAVPAFAARDALRRAA